MRSSRRFPADPAAIAAALTAALLDPGRARMGAAGRRWVAEEWSWDASARRLARLLSPACVLADELHRE